jgi:hypothetical protein
MLVKRMLGVSRPLAQFQRFMVKAFPRLSLPGVARVSLGLGNTPEDIDALLDALGRISRQSATVDNPFRRQKTPVQGEMEAFAKAVADRVYI